MSHATSISPEPVPDSRMELQELKGIGPAMEERIHAAGITSVDELAEASTDTLTEQGISESKADKLLSRASRQSVVFQTAGEAKQEKEAKDHIPSGMDDMDDLLGGGYLEGHVVGISGASSTGKTQTVFRALGAAVEYDDRPVVYVETERERFDADRIVSLSDLSESDIEENIFRTKAYSLDQQREAYDAIRENFDDVSLVVVDSFTARFRLEEEFTGRTGLTDRNSAMVGHLNAIERMASSLGCPVLLTLQVMGNPSRFGGSDSTWGGSLMSHQITYNLKLSQAQGEFRKAELAGHPSQPEGEVLLSIGENEMKATKNE